MRIVLYILALLGCVIQAFGQDRPGGGGSGNYNPANVAITGGSLSNVVVYGNGQHLTNMPLENVLNHGVVGDGVTDDTIAMQALWSTPGCYYLGTNTYLLGKMTITNYVTLEMNGCQLKFAFGATNIGIFIRMMLNTNINIIGQWSLNGQQFGDITTNQWFGWNNSGFALNPFNPNVWNIFGYWQPQANSCRHAFQINAESPGTISAPTIFGFSGIGLVPCSIHGTSSIGTPKCNLLGANCYSNLMGLYLFPPYTFAGYVTNWLTNEVPGAQTAEYYNFHDLHLGSNTVGMVFTAANDNLVNSEIAGNYIDDIELGSSINEHHGTITGVLFNHSGNSMLQMHGCLQGELFTACQFRGNALQDIIMDDCAGVVFQDCQFDAPITITNQNTPVGNYNFLQNFTYDGYWSESVTVTTDDHLYYDNGYSYNTFPDLENLAIAASGVTNTGGRTGIAVITATATTFWTSNAIAVATSTNISFTGTIALPIPPNGCVHAASGLSGYLYYPN